MTFVGESVTLHNMIRVKVHLAGVFGRGLQSPQVVTLPAEATVEDLIETLKKRYPETRSLWRGQDGYRQVFVSNEQATSPDQRLARGDGETTEVNILVMPPVAGGCPPYCSAGSGV